MDRFQVYKDIEARTNGEIYIGVVGPVRTGKSTFIKRFMDVLVLPEMEDEHARMRTHDYDNGTKVCAEGSSKNPAC